VDYDTNRNTLRDTWARGATGIGGWLSLREPLIAEAASTLDLDYVCIDMQHGLSDISDVFALLQAMSPNRPTPIVRVPWNEPGIIGRSLDMGALGVIVPMVNSVEEARAAVAACRYAPVGRRSVGPVVPNQRYGAGYFAAANERVLCIPMIETEVAVSRIDDILSVPGIDAIYVGPSDLAVSMGLMPGLDQADERFAAAISTVLGACARHGIVAGIHGSAGVAAKRHAQGFRMITVATDLVSAIGGLRADATAARSAVLGNTNTPGSPAASSDPYRA
jgi:4-hydroxy-2-oxoheptanedioate aldolase